MNARIIAVFLLVVSIVLAVFLLNTKKAATAVEKEAAANLASLSNTLHATTARLEEQRKVNQSLETNLTQRIRDLGSLSNRWTQLRLDLIKIQNDSQKAAESAASEIQDREAQIGELEKERQQLGERVDEMAAFLDKLSDDIRETERKLAASEGDREFLQDELRRLMTEKAELERRLTDIVFLRDQVRKLREELATTRRFDFWRPGFFTDRKGATLQRDNIQTYEGTPSPDSSLNVELSPDGAVVAPETNQPPRQ